MTTFFGLQLEEDNRRLSAISIGDEPIAVVDSDNDEGNFVMRKVGTPPFLQSTDFHDYRGNFNCGSSEAPDRKRGQKNEVSES